MAAKGINEEKIQVTVATYRWGFVVAGAVGAIIGLFILLWPNVMSSIFSILIAIYALVAGVIFEWIAIRGVGTAIMLRVARGLAGLALIIGGVLIFIFTDTASAIMVDVVGVTLGILWLFEGIMTLIIMRGKSLNSWFLAYVIVAIAVGVLMLLTPVWGGWPLQWLFGLSLLGLGIAQVVRGLTANPRLVVQLEEESGN